MKKGFTLIELLAVILILGIIALIAIPTVNNIIQEAKYGAFKSSSDNIMKSMEESCQMSLIKNQQPVLQYDFVNGSSSYELNIKGKLPDEGYVILDNNCSVTEYYLKSNNNIYTNVDGTKEDYMLKASSETESIFYTLYPSYYENIQSVYFVKTLSTPEDAIEIKDPSLTGNQRIKSWLVKNEEKYDLYVGSKKTIYANYDSTSLFKNMTSVTTMELTNFDTSFTTKMKRMFNDLKNIINLNLNNFNTENVTDMSYMFSGCEALLSLNIANFNTSNVTNMSYMFNWCTNIETIDISNFDTSNVTNMHWMFYLCNKLKSLDLSKWDTSKVTDMQNLFYRCWELETLGDISKWDTGKVRDMSSMFNQCYKFDPSTVIENWDISSVTTISYIFYGSKMTEIDLSRWNTSNLKNVALVFLECTKLEKVNLSGWDLRNVTNSHDMFIYSYKLNNIIMENTNVESVNLVINVLINKTELNPGTLKITGIDDSTQVDTATASSKYWNISL